MFLSKLAGTEKSDIIIIKDINFAFKILSVNASNKSVEIVYGDQSRPIVIEQLEIELSNKPYIAILWLGVITLVIGLLMSVHYRKTLQLVKVD